MKFTRNWLQEYVEIDGISPEKLADDLTMLGLEVDSVEPLFEDLAQLKTAQVIATERHPDADKLTLCSVAVGDDILQIVCGAPNVRKDLCVVIALPGTVLPGNFKIKKSKVRGIESQGMLCSERELGLSDEHTGIMELPEGTPHGKSFIEVSGLQDLLIEVDLTPNRPDCASVIGIAREVAGANQKQLHVPFKNCQLKEQSRSFSVEVQDADLCPRYGARLIQGLNISQSPWWIRKRLLAVGLRPINNVVDITNLVMMEYGQPLHAFDFKTLAGSRIIVRTPEKNEKQFTTLDNVTRTLEADTLMICDADGPVAVAGVMGGLDSEVTDKTVDVLLESACFNAVSIRKTARRLNLPSEASYRFERGVDPGGAINAMERAVTLMCEIAGGTAEPGGVDIYDGKRPDRHLSLRVARTSELLGTELTAEQIIELLHSIEIPCKRENSDTVIVTVPTFRVDLEREVDLVEEIARLIGYNAIPLSLPDVNMSYPEQDSERIKRNYVRKFMTINGFSETINYSFYSSAYGAQMLFTDNDKRSEYVSILNPLSEDQDVMRTTLLPCLLENIRRNINFQQTSCKLFEIGKVFFPLPGEPLPLEKSRLAGVISGQRNGSHLPYHFKGEEVDIFDAKGVVEALLEEMRVTASLLESGIELIIPDKEQVEPFAEADYAIILILENAQVGTIGKLKNDVLRAFGIKRDVYYFDLDFTALSNLAPAPKAFSSLPVYPSVKRDIALVVPKSIAAQDLINTVLTSREKIVEHCDIFDVFQGEKIERGFKSVALSITYRSQTKTLTEKNVEKAHSKLVKALTDKFGGSFREA